MPVAPGRGRASFHELGAPGTAFPQGQAWRCLQTGSWGSLGARQFEKEATYWGLWLWPSVWWVGSRASFLWGVGAPRARGQA